MSLKFSARPFPTLQPSISTTVRKGKIYDPADTQSHSSKGPKASTDHWSHCSYRSISTGLPPLQAMTFPFLSRSKQFTQRAWRQCLPEQSCSMLLTQSCLLSLIISLILVHYGINVSKLSWKAEVRMGFNAELGYEPCRTSNSLLLSS